MEQGEYTQQYTTAQAQQSQAQAQQSQAQSQQAQAQQYQQTRIDEHVINVQLLKKYRAMTYDIHDEEYAKQMKKHDIPDAFKEFTDGLMDETHINRFSLLQAIEDYNKTRPVIMLSLVFQDAAFNFRPYQSCVIS